MKKMLFCLTAMFLLGAAGCAPASPAKEEPVSSFVPSDAVSDEKKEEGITVAASYADSLAGDARVRVMTLTATENGKTLWTYTSPRCEIADRDPVTFFAVKDGLVYFNQQNTVDENGVVIRQDGLAALDASTGELLWQNSDFIGEGACFDIDNDGTVYASGWYGPDCIAVDKSGKTLWLVENANPAFTRVTQVEAFGGGICLTFDDAPYYSEDSTLIIRKNGTEIVGV